jgi:hypothetical protein
MQQQGIATRKWRRDTRTGTSPVQNKISNPRQPKNTRAIWNPIQEGKRQNPKNKGHAKTDHP